MKNSLTFIISKFSVIIHSELFISELLPLYFIYDYFKYWNSPSVLALESCRTLPTWLNLSALYIFVCDLHKYNEMGNFIIFVQVTDKYILFAFWYFYQYKGGVNILYSGKTRHRGSG